MAHVESSHEMAEEQATSSTSGGPSWITHSIPTGPGIKVSSSNLSETRVLLREVFHAQAGLCFQG